MKIVIRHEDELEELELPIQDIQPFIDLMKAHGYMDAEGTEYKFGEAYVEHRAKVVILVRVEE